MDRAPITNDSLCYRNDLFLTANMSRHDDIVAYRGDVHWVRKPDYYTARIAVQRSQSLSSSDTVAEWTISSKATGFDRRCYTRRSFSFMDGWMERRRKEG